MTEVDILNGVIGLPPREGAFEGKRGINEGINEKCNPGNESGGTVGI